MIRYFALLLAVAAHAQSTGSAEGVVINSANGKGLPRVLVVLEGSTDSYAAQTDAEGRFRIADIVPGSYVAKAVREGFTMGARVVPHQAVEAGKKIALQLRLVPLGAISGRVIDTESDPISHARVEALRYSYPAGKRTLVAAASTTSNDKGEYRIADLPPGRYYVRAALPFSTLDAGNAAMRMRGIKPQLTYAATFRENTVDAADARPVDVAAGGDVPDANVQLRPEAYYNLRVAVTGPRDAQIAFSCRPTVPRASMSGMVGGNLGSGRTFLCPDHVPGSYVVEVSDRAHTLHARKTVSLLHGDTEVALQLAPPIGISGVVRVEGNTKLARAGMRVVLEAGDDWDTVGASVREDGAFTIPLAQAIAYRIGVSTPAGGYLKSIYQGTQDLTMGRVDLARSTEPLSIVIGTDGGTIAGVAKDGRGQPVEDAAVVLVPAGTRRDWVDLTRSAVAGAEGRFQLRDIAPGEYLLLAWEDVEPGAPLNAEFRAPFEKDAAKVSVKAGDKLSIRVVAR